MRARLLASRRCRAVLRPRRLTSAASPALSDEQKRVTNLEIVRQNTALITYADGNTETKDTRTLRQDDAATSAWMLARATLDATASEFACAALDESPFLSRAALLDRKLHGAVRNHVDTPATRFGQASEPLAVQAYRDKTGFDVRATGLYTCDELRYGASPDGVVVRQMRFHWGISPRSSGGKKTCSVGRRAPRSASRRALPSHRRTRGVAAAASPRCGCGRTARRR